MIVYFLVKIVPKGIEKMTNKRSHLYHIKTNNPQHLHYRYWGYFNNDFEGRFGKNGPLKIYSLLDLPIFLEDLFCSKIIRQKFVFLFFCAKIKPSTRTCVRILSK